MLNISTKYQLKPSRSAVIAKAYDSIQQGYIEFDELMQENTTAQEKIESIPDLPYGNWKLKALVAILNGNSQTRNGGGYGKQFLRTILPQLIDGCLKKIQ